MYGIIPSEFHHPQLGEPIEARVWDSMVSVEYTGLEHMLSHDWTRWLSPHLNCFSFPALPVTSHNDGSWDWWQTVYWVHMCNLPAYPRVRRGCIWRICATVRLCGAHKKVGAWINGHNFADDFFKYIFWNGNHCILMTMIKKHWR